MAATTHIHLHQPTDIAPLAMPTAAVRVESPPASTPPVMSTAAGPVASTPETSRLRLPTHAARRVTTALRGADGRLAVVCGA